MSSLLSRQSRLSSAVEQLKYLEQPDFDLEKFSQKLTEYGLSPLRPTKLEIFQINLGKMCNQSCRHCHVDAGPDRKEMMTQETMQICIDLVQSHRFPIVDLTGGAPEMNPHFRWFVQELRRAGAHVIDRCNLTIILANSKYRELPSFFRDNQVEVISSLPHYSQGMTDRQRGSGVFDRSIRALKMLNDVGYGKEGTGLKLNLVYNPSGCFLPGHQASLEVEFKKRLKSDFDIDFSKLFCITNMPISRYLEYLIDSGNYESYMNTLVSAFNPAAIPGVMCRNTLSVGWDGALYDCDFNQMLEMRTHKKSPQHIKDFDLNALESRSIEIGQHCYGCTAGSGSSCGGETTLLANPGGSKGTLECPSLK